jgi:HSP20 family protein
MAIVSRDPFEALMGLQRALDSFRASDWLEAGPSGTGAYPPINVFQKGDDFVALAEASGLNKASLDVQIKNNTVRISGSKNINYPDGASIHRLERVEGRFDRAFSVPFVIDADKVKAEYKDGILALYLPRAEGDKPKSIAIV